MDGGLWKWRAYGGRKMSREREGETERERERARAGCVVIRRENPSVGKGLAAVICGEQH